MGKYIPAMGRSQHGWAISSPGAFPDMASGPWAAEYNAPNSPYQSTQIGAKPNRRHFRAPQSMQGATMSPRAISDYQWTGTGSTDQVPTTRLKAALDYSTDNSNNGSTGNRHHGIIPPPGAARFGSVASDALHGRSVAPAAWLGVGVPPSPPPRSEPRPPTTRNPTRSPTRTPNARRPRTARGPQIGNEDLSHTRSMFGRTGATRPTEHMRPWTARHHETLNGHPFSRTISINDFDKLAYHIHCKVMAPEHRQQLERAWKRGDSSGCGKVSSSYFCQVLADHIQVRLTEPQLDRLIQCFCETPMVTPTSNSVKYVKFMRYFERGARDGNKYMFQPQQKMKTGLF